MTIWDITNERDEAEIIAESEAAFAAIRTTTGRKSGFLETESDVVDAARNAKGAEFGDFVEEHIVTLRILVKNWMTQR